MFLNDSLECAQRTERVGFNLIGWEARRYFRKILSVWCEMQRHIIALMCSEKVFVVSSFSTGQTYSSRWRLGILLMQLQKLPSPMKVAQDLF